MAVGLLKLSPPKSRLRCVRNSTMSCRVRLLCPPPMRFTVAAPAPPPLRSVLGWDSNMQLRPYKSPQRGATVSQQKFMGQFVSFRPKAYTPQLGLRLGFDSMGHSRGDSTAQIYLRPDGVSTYLRPDGVSTYLRPDGVPTYLRPDGVSIYLRPDGVSIYLRT